MDVEQAVIELDDDDELIPSEETRDSCSSDTEAYNSPDTEDEQCPDTCPDLIELFASLRSDKPQTVTAASKGPSSCASQLISGPSTPAASQPFYGPSTSTAPSQHFSEQPEVPLNLSAPPKGQ